MPSLTDWRLARLSDVADLRTEKVIPSEGDTRPYIALEHLAQGRPTVLGWSSAGTAASAKTVFRKGDVLFGKLRPNLRKAVAAPFDGLCSTDILPLFGLDGVDSGYLLQLAQWRPLQQHAVATASGTKMPRTSWKQLREFTFPLPPSSQQRKIATILSSVDVAIETTQAVIDQVQVVKRGLMQQLLTRGLPGRRTRFKQTVIGEVPETWIETALGNVLELKRGYDLPRQNRTAGTVPVVSSSGMTDTHGEARVKGPGVVTGRYGNIGQVFFVNDDFWPLNTTLYVRDFKGSDPRFISYFLRGLDFSAHSGKTAVPGRESEPLAPNYYRLSAGRWRAACHCCHSLLGGRRDQQEPVGDHLHADGEVRHHVRSAHRRASRQFGRWTPVILRRMGWSPPGRESGGRVRSGSRKAGCSEQGGSASEVFRKRQA